AAAEPAEEPANVEETSPATEESEMLEAQQDDAAETDIWVNPSWGLTQHDFDYNRVTVLGTDFPASTPVNIALDSQTMTTEESLDNGGVNVNVSGFFEPGFYTLTVTVGDVSDSMEIEIEPGGYNTDLCLGSSICYFDEPGSVSVWDMSRVGISYQLTGF